MAYFRKLNKDILVNIDHLVSIKVPTLPSGSEPGLMLNMSDGDQIEIQGEDAAIFQAYLDRCMIKGTQ